MADGMEPLTSTSREDFDFIEPKLEDYDVLQSNPGPTTMTSVPSFPLLIMAQGTVTHPKPDNPLLRSCLELSTPVG